MFFAILEPTDGQSVGASMTTARRNQLKNRNRYLFWIAEIDRCIQEIGVSGCSSASLSSGGGSQSYTRADTNRLLDLRARYVSRVESIEMALAAYPNSTGIRHVQTVRSGGFW